MKTRTYILTVLTAWALGFADSIENVTAAESSSRPGKGRPNILFIMADDVGWGDFQCYNPQGKIPTPNIDRLAREGMRFSDAHTAAAVCAPSRYAVATGNYPWRGRLPNGTMLWNHEPQLPPGQKTIGHLLQEAGYRTGLFGKVHFGGVFEHNAAGTEDFTRPMKVGPIQWGFEYSYVLLGGHQSPPYLFFENNRVDGNPSKVTQLAAGPLNGGVLLRPGPGLPDWDSRQVGAKLVEKVVAFIDQAMDKPFYVHLSTDGAHAPYSPPETLLGTPVAGRSKMTPHSDMVHEVDVIVGKLVEALEKRGLIEQTLIIVTSDNGGIPSERHLGHDAVGGLRGAKTEIWEGGHRVPFIAVWKGRISAGTVRHQVIGTHDIVPTFVDLAGGRFDADQMLDSVSLAPVLLGRRGDDQPVRQTLLIQSRTDRDAFTERQVTAEGRPAASAEPQTADVPFGQGLASDSMAHALREGPWKLVFNIADDKPAALYNLADDLTERKNMIADAAQAGRVRRMENFYRDIRRSKRSTPGIESPNSIEKN